jgi:cobyrinic acid a,c-diamide synthase
LVYYRFNPGEIKMQRRIIIAGTGSGVGKTTLTIGLMAALRRQGLTVQGFKCGPDYIDPSYHTAVTGRPSRNLDSWMMDAGSVKEIFVKGSQGADISVIEGVMGLFDGKNPASNEGSAAEISQIIETSVILIVNCQSMARSAAAIVKGFQLFDEQVQVAGVIANRVGSENHYKLVKTAIEQACGIPVLGYLKREEEIEIPERHLGLIPSIERGELDPLFNKLANLIEQSINLEQILEISQGRKLHAKPKLFTPETKAQTKVRIAVALDQAFNFYYPENLELLEWYGAEIIYFSPLAGDKLPDQADGLYIGGGFPEEFAAQLASNEEVKRSIRQAVQSGLPTLAECGGFMYLSESIQTTKETSFPMLGIIPGHVSMQKKLAALGYREVKGSASNPFFTKGMEAKGHEFHYSTYTAEQEHGFAYETKGMRGIKHEGFVTDNLCAGYTHLHFASNPALVKRWIELCEIYRAEHKKLIHEETERV